MAADSEDVYTTLEDAVKAANKEDYIFRIDPSKKFLVIPYEERYYAALLAVRGVSIHEVMRNVRRLHFDIENDGVGIDPKDHSMIGAFTEYIRHRYNTKVVVFTASSTTRLSYHVICLDVAAKTLVTHKDVLKDVKAVGIVPAGYFDDIYVTRKSLRFYGAPKEDGTRPFTLVREISDNVDESTVDWMFVQGPYKQLLMTREDAEKVRVSSSNDAMWETAREILSDRYPDLVLSDRKTGDGYRLNSIRAWDCDICGTTHDNDNAIVYLGTDYVTFYCYSAARRGIRATLKISLQQRS